MIAHYTAVMAFHDVSNFFNISEIMVHCSVLTVHSKLYHLFIPVLITGNVTSITTG